MKFDLIVVFISLLLTGYTALYDVNYLVYEKPIPYSQTKTIGWDDFRGLNKPGNNLYGKNEFANIYTEIVLDHTSDTSYSVTTYFHPCRSYVFNKNAVDQNLLNHELCHFKITEYYARLIRKEISELPAEYNRTDIDEIKEKYNRLENDLQFQYDEETMHSYVLFKQKEWEAKVNKWLDSLKQYENPEVIAGTRR
jgi:hypothetical protein